MLTQQYIYRLALALSLSIGALTAAVVIQGIILFPQDFQTLHDPEWSSIRRLTLVADGKRAIALLRHSPRVLLHEPQCTVLLCELTENNHSLRRVDVGFTPCWVAGARGTDRLFIASRAGDLYCFDLIAPALPPRLLGRHAEGYPFILECTRDGSIVIAGDSGSISAWSSETATCLWRRSDIDVVGVHFHAPTSRLFCGIVAGPCLELDRFTGATLRTFAAHVESAISLDVSSDGRQLATLDFHGQCTVTDLETGQELWSKSFSQPGVGPRFSPDGQRVVAAAPACAPAVQVLSTMTGELLAELRGAKAEIAGIEVTTRGIVYAWDASGTLTAWHLATRTLLRHYNITS